MKLLLVLLFLGGVEALATPFEKLHEKVLLLNTGWSLFKSDTNFGVDGDKVDLRTNGSLSSLTQHSFFLDLDYGLTEVWSVTFKTGLLSAQINPSSPLPGLSSGLGLTDTGVGFRWQGRKRRPAVAVEGLVFFPPYSVAEMEPQELALGDGIAGIVLRIPLATRIRKLSLGITPGLRLRFGRFSHQFLVNSHQELRFKKWTLGLFEEGIFSLSKDPQLPNSGLNAEAGSGGSFSRLSTAPDSLNLGLSAGHWVSEKVKLETFFSRTLWGQATADGYRLGLQVCSVFDFFTPDNREPIKEVPFNAE